MRKAGKYAIIVAIAAACGFAPFPARAAEILYSTFDPGDTHANAGYCVSGNSTPNCGPLTDRWIAAEFSPNQTDTLAQINLALTYNSGVNSSEIDLVGDSSGLPGSTVLESWAGVTTSLSNLSLSSQLNPLLMAGQDYWIVAKGDNSSALTFWYDSAATTKLSLLSLNDGGSWISTAGTSAFSVLGQEFVAGVPEPQTWVMMILGFGVTGLKLRKFRRSSVTC